MHRFTEFAGEPAPHEQVWPAEALWDVGLLAGYVSVKLAICESRITTRHSPSSRTSCWVIG